MLNSRFHFSSGAPMEDSLWLDPFITDRGGNVVWQVSPGTKFPSNISGRQVDHGVLRLGGYQSCVWIVPVLDCRKISPGACRWQ